MDDSTTPLQYLAGKTDSPLAAVTTSESATAGDMSVPQQGPQAAAEDQEANIFVAAQRGDVDLIRQLIESGKAKATDRDPQNITPLHWAAINAQVTACRYLLDQGAEVDARGGDLVATPMQWAARNGYLYVIQLLVAHGADPNIADAQGYNTLHLVTHSSSVMPLLYVLQQPVPADARDAQGHTALMWAAYQGDALSVDLLLKHGGSPVVKDDAGLTPLHWAVVRGNRAVIRRLVEAGADVTAKDGDGRTARDMAVELKSLGAYKRALEEGGLDENGLRKSKPLSERNSKIAIFLLPTLFFYIIFSTLSILPWYTGIILAMAEFFGMHHIITRVFLNTATYAESLKASPYFAGIILASMVWVFYAWVTRLVPQTQSHAFAHLVFAIAFGLCAYNFFRSITLDPGTCPRPGSDAELKTIIEDLASEGRLNGQTFCVQCMARKPLRSKHCRTCDKCIARCDHHCPWVWNCVGVNNHRQFILFIATLLLGITTFDYLTYAFFSSMPTPVERSPSCPLPSDLCALAHADSFLVAVSLWATLQLTWTSVLLAAQLWQVARQTTSYEVSNLGRYGFMGGRGASMAGQMGHHHQHRPAAGADIAGEDAPASPAHAHAHRPGAGGACGTSFLLNLLGLDRFTRGRAASGLARASSAAGRAHNPFDLGLAANCADFWAAGGELGVDYARVYDVPAEGFREARKRREREEREEERGTGGRKGLRKTLLMGLGIGRSRAGYEPVSQV